MLSTAGEGTVAGLGRQAPLGGMGGLTAANTQEHCLCRPRWGSPPEYGGAHARRIALGVP
jgi:hypothetical protein